MLTVYTTKTCAVCPTVKKYLDMKKIKYQVEDVTDNEKLRDQLHKITGYRTVPITTDGKSYVVGFKPAELQLIGGQEDFVT